MTAVLAFLGTKFGMGVLAGSGVLAGFFGPKMIRPYIAKIMGQYIANGLDPKIADPKKKELLQNFVKAGILLAEYSIPDRGQGTAKKDLVVKALAGLGGGVLPSSVQIALGSMVQEVFDSMDDELKKVTGS